MSQLWPRVLGKALMEPHDGELSPLWERQLAIWLPRQWMAVVRKRISHDRRPRQWANQQVDK